MRGLVLEPAAVRCLDDGTGVANDPHGLGVDGVDAVQRKGYEIWLLYPCGSAVRGAVDMAKASRKPAGLCIGKVHALYGSTDVIAGPV